MPQIVSDSFGSPRSVVEAANPGLLDKGVVKRASNAIIDGFGRLKARGGTRAAVTLLDEASNPVDTVCAVSPFRAGALAVGWSSAFQKCYLYAIDADVSTATRIVPGNGLDYLWSGVTTAPVVWIAEGLDCAYIAHGEAADADSLSFPSRIWAPLRDELAFLGTPSFPNAYFSGFVSYHQHLVGWGYDSGTDPVTAYRPEYLRIGSPNFGEDLFGGGFGENGDAAFSVGNRVRAVRERILGCCVAGDLCFVGTPYGLHALSGYGRDSWQISTLDSSLGVVSSRAMVNVSGTLYYWSPRGPVRVSGLSEPDPLWDALPDTVARIANPQQIVGAYDTERDQVMFVFGHPDTDGENRAMCAFDVRRDVWLGPVSPLGTAVFCMGAVTPVLAASVASPGPSGPPTDAVSGVNTNDGHLEVSLTPGDTQPGTETIWELYYNSGTLIQSSTTASTVTTFTFTGVPVTNFLILTGQSLYWTARHMRNGRVSALLGPTVIPT